MKPWTLEIEDSYTNFVQCGEAVQSFDKLSPEKEESDDMSDNWIEVEDEASLSPELMSFNTAGATTYTAPHWCDSLLPNDVLEHTQVKGISI
ncbi:hypothetical protein NLG97_g4230 [Lecanicillium saksenae]|uniref:Uncharacterized protein n=1 Tax=Lecanicillium saksenae TaxID=468837 RepID=A0ACC1QVV5_9HYPO|nr:hypothetical protein NLG97_g4230 [Lecanicillium saksenae]